MRKKEEFSLILEINDYITYISIGCRRTKKSQLKIRKYFKGLKVEKSKLSEPRSNAGLRCLVGLRACI